MINLFIALLIAHLIQAVLIAESRGKSLAQDIKEAEEKGGTVQVAFGRTNWIVGFFADVLTTVVVVFLLSLIPFTNVWLFALYYVVVMYARLIGTYGSAMLVSSLYLRRHRKSDATVQQFKQDVEQAGKQSKQEEENND